MNPPRRPLPQRPLASCACAFSVGESCEGIGFSHSKAREGAQELLSFVLPGETQAGRDFVFFAFHFKRLERRERNDNGMILPYSPSNLVPGRKRGPGKT